MLRFCIDSIVFVHLRKEKKNIVVNYTFGECAEEIPNPVITFEQAFSPYPDILDLIYNQNFTEPSPIQCQAWPILLSGKDLIGIAQTGTGKTVATYIYLTRIRLEMIIYISIFKR